MTLTEYATILGTRIHINGHADSGLLTPVRLRWTVSLDGVSVVDGGLLSSTYGSGSSPRKAAADYVRQIAGKPILFSRYDHPDLRTRVIETLKPY